MLPFYDSETIKQKRESHRIELFTFKNPLTLQDAKKAIHVAIMGRHITFSPRDEKNGVKSELRDVIDCFIAPLEENIVVLIKFDERRDVIGFLIGKIKDNQVWHLAYIYVDPLYRCSKVGGVFPSGSGSNLLESFEDMAKLNRVKKIFALTWTGGSKETIDWYKNKGFQENETLRESFNVPETFFFSRRMKDGKWINECDIGSESYGYIYSLESNKKEPEKALNILQKYNLNINIFQKNKENYHLITMEKYLLQE